MGKYILSNEPLAPNRVGTQMTDRQLKEILYCLIYYRFFAHGTDGHNDKVIIALQAIDAGYSFAMGGDWFELWRNGVIVLNATVLPG